MPVQLVLEDFFPAARRSFKVASLRTIKFVASVNAVDDEVTHLKIKIKDQFIRTNKQTNKQTNKHTHTHTHVWIYSDKLFDPESEEKSHLVTSLPDQAKSQTKQTNSFPNPRSTHGDDIERVRIEGKTKFSLLKNLDFLLNADTLIDSHLGPKNALFICALEFVFLRAVVGRRGGRRCGKRRRHDNRRVLPAAGSQNEIVQGDVTQGAGTNTAWLRA